MVPHWEGEQPNLYIQPWSKARRVVAKVEHFAGELFTRLRFMVNNTHLTNRKLVHFYDQSGKAEQWIKGGQEVGKDDAAELPPISEQ